MEICLESSISWPFIFKFLDRAEVFSWRLRWTSLRHLFQLLSLDQFCPGFKPVTPWWPLLLIIITSDYTSLSLRTRLLCRITIWSITVFWLSRSDILIRKLGCFLRIEYKIYVCKAAELVLPLYYYKFGIQRSRVCRMGPSSRVPFEIECNPLSQSENISAGPLLLIC